MLRSLSSSITGLKNHQVAMDIIGNNIANVNTTGYKAQRVTFSESFSQLLQGATKPSEGGGTNPLQVGLGMTVGSIDTILTQGNLQSTGQVTDLAVEGDAYFAVSSGEGNFFTRNGGFQMDSNGNLVLPTNGFILQGKIADSDGSFPVGTTVGDIRIPFNEQSPANSTSAVSFSRNLDADAGARGSVVYSQTFLAAAATTDLAETLSNSKGVNLGIREGDVLTFYAENGTTGVPATDSYTVQSGDTLEIIRSFMQQFLRNNTDTQTVVSMDAGKPGALEIHTNPNDSILNLQVTSDNALSNSILNKAWNFPTTIPSGTLAGSGVNTDALRSPATTTDALEDLYDSSGDGLDFVTNGGGLEDGDVIQVSGAVGGEGVTSTPLTYVTSATGIPTTLQDLLDNIKDSLQLPVRDGTVKDNLSVSVNTGGSDDGIPDGTIVIRGAKGLDFALTNISIKADNSNNNQNTPALFNANLSFTEFQAAQNTGVFDTSITIYDESGDAHILTMTYIHTGVPNEWDWEISTSGDEEILAGSSGSLEFGRDGTVASFSYDDGSTQLEIDPVNGSEVMDINLNVGGPKNFQGITQFAAATTVSAVGQDGFPTGSLQEISIDEEGVLTGSFSNGVSKALAQIMLVEFTNPGGLMQVSDSVFSTSSNSGDPIFTIPGTSSRIKPAALEMSNVDLAREFTSMITTQRGYQANARVITVSDSMLEELVSLKR